MKTKVLLFWSGGKDSALSLYHLKKNAEFEVAGLFSTINEKNNLIPYHGIPEALLIDQAKLQNIPLIRVYLPDQCNNETYIKIVQEKLSKFARAGIRHVAFGDIALEDIRLFRENLLKPLEMKALFPLWGKNSSEVAREFLSTGHRALVSSVMTDKLDASFLANEYNEEFISRLPSGVDPAGENGEFHTFVTFGPGYKMRVPFSKAIAINEGPYLVSTLKEP